MRFGPRRRRDHQTGCGRAYYWAPAPALAPAIARSPWCPGGVPTDPKAFDLDRDRTLASLGVERDHEAPVSEHRRVDPAGQVTEVFQCPRHLRLSLGEHLR